MGLSAILPLAVALLIGIVGGAVLVNMLLGSRIRSLLPDHGEANTGSNVLGITRTPEPPPGALTSEVLQKQEEIRTLRTKLTASDSEVDTLKKRCTELEEKASKATTLETELAALQKRVQEAPAGEASASDAIAKTPESEEKQSAAAAVIEGLKKELSELREKSEASTTKAEEQAKALQALETEKTGLAAKRDEMLKDQEALALIHKEKEATTTEQIESLKKELAELREKSEASSTRAENQQNAIKSLEDEKIELSKKRDELLKDQETQKAKLTKLEAAKSELSEKQELLLKEQMTLKAQLVELTAQLDAERKQTNEKAQLLGKAREQLSITLKVLGTEMADVKNEKAKEKAEEKVVAVAAR